MTAVTTQKILTQSEIVDHLRSEGYNIGIRTLRYWRSCGYIPELYIGPINKGYPSEFLERIRDLCDLRERRIGKVIHEYFIESERFLVFEIRITKPDSYQIELYTDKGTLVERRKELNCNGIF